MGFVAENTMLWAIGVKSDTERLLEAFWRQNFVAKYTNWAQHGVKSDIDYEFIKVPCLHPQLVDADPAAACAFSVADVRAVEKL